VPSHFSEVTQLNDFDTKIKTVVDFVCNLQKKNTILAYNDQQMIYDNDLNKSKVSNRYVRSIIQNYGLNTP